MKILFAFVKYNYDTLIYKLNKLKTTGTIVNRELCFSESR